MAQSMMRNAVALAQSGSRQSMILLVPPARFNNRYLEGERGEFS